MVVAIPYFQEQDYSILLAEFQNDNPSLNTWEGFIRLTKQQEDQYKGHGIERVYITPQELFSWCQKQHIKIDYQACCKFAANTILTRPRNKCGD